MADRFDETQIRRRIEDLERALERAQPSSVDNGSPALLVKTATKTTYPTVAGSVFYCQILTPGGNPIEGAAGTFAAKSTHVYAVNVGGLVPPVGTKLIAVATGGQWVIRYA